MKNEEIQLGADTFSMKINNQQKRSMSLTPKGRCISMASKRMIDKKISVSEQVANLGIEGALFFTWMITHADDCGVLPYSPRTLKALIVPMFDEYTTETIGIHLETMRNQGLIEEFEYNKEKFWKLPSFFRTQTLKKDRQPSIIFNLKLTDDPKKNWKLCEDVMETKWKPNGTATVPEVSKEDKEDRLSSVGEYEGRNSTEDGGGIEKLRKTIKTLKGVHA